MSEENLVIKHDPKHKEQMIKVSISRKGFQEILGFLGAFGFGAIGAVLFQSFGINPANSLAKGLGVPDNAPQIGGALNGVFNVFNDALGKKLGGLVNDERTMAIIKVSQLLNWDLNDAMALVDKNKELIISLSGGSKTYNSRELDPVGLSKKLDITEYEAKKLLNQDSWGDFAINVVLKGGAIVGFSLVTGGAAGAAASYIPISNQFAAMITQAAAGQLAGRLTQEGLGYAAAKLGQFSCKPRGYQQVDDVPQNDVDAQGQYSAASLVKGGGQDV